MILFSHARSIGSPSVRADCGRPIAVIGRPLFLTPPHGKASNHTPRSNPNRLECHLFVPSSVIAMSPMEKPRCRQSNPCPRHDQPSLSVSTR